MFLYKSILFWGYKLKRNALPLFRKMFFRSLLKTRLLRPTIYGLSHHNSLLLSGSHWMKCAPVNPYFYMFSTQTQQPKNGSVKVPIENSNTTEEVETPAKNQMELQKEINKNSNTTEEVETPAKNQMELQKEINTQDLRQKEPQLKLDAINNRFKKLSKEVEGKEHKELQQQIKAAIKIMVQKNDQNLEIIVKTLKEKNLNLVLYQILANFLMVVGICIGGGRIYKNYKNKKLAQDQHRKEEQRIQKLPQETYIKSTNPPTETKQLTFVEEYIKTSSRAQVKQMLILSDQNIPREIQYISGVPGVGKTTTLKEIIKQMKNENCQISYFSFKEDDDVDKTIDKILTSTDYIQAHPKIKAQNKKKYLIIDQFNQITCKKAESTMTMEQRVAKKEHIVKKMLRLTHFFRYNIVFISSDLNFFSEILQTPGVSLSDFQCLNFNQPSIRQQTEYLKGLRSKTDPALKLDDEVIIAHMIQNYSTFREMQPVLGTYFSSSGDRAKTLQKSKLQMNQSKLKMKMHSQISVAKLSQKDYALYEACVQKLMPMPVDDKFYDQLNQNNILNQRHFRSLLTLRGFESYYNENSSKFEKKLPKQFKEQFKDHKIHCKEVFLDRPAN